jgi:hypothetical protein
MNERFGRRFFHFPLFNFANPLRQQFEEPSFIYTISTFYILHYTKVIVRVRFFRIKKIQIRTHFRIEKTPKR